MTIDQLSSLIKSLNKDEVVLFPGTFAPWHQGHMACLNLMPENHHIIITPDRNPEKLPVPTDISTIRDIVSQSANIQLFEGFLANEDSNPTFYWYEKLKEKLPNIKISLLMGFDSYASINGWIQGHDLIKIVDHIYVAARLNLKEDFERIKLEYQKISKNFSATFLGHHEFESISSTKINQGLK